MNINLLLIQDAHLPLPFFLPENIFDIIHASGAIKIKNRKLSYNFGCRCVEWREKMLGYAKIKNVILEFI